MNTNVNHARRNLELMANWITTSTARSTRMCSSNLRFMWSLMMKLRWWSVQKQLSKIRNKVSLNRLLKMKVRRLVGVMRRLKSKMRMSGSGVRIKRIRRRSRRRMWQRRSKKKRSNKWMRNIIWWKRKRGKNN